MAASQDTVHAKVTVVVCTRGRSESIAQTIDSILSGDYPDFELIVVDQSADDLTAASLQPYLSDRRLRLERSTTMGLAKARNIGVGLARTEFIAVTDDDCVAERNWLRELLHAFETDGRIALVFGNVTPARHDAAAGFVPSYVRGEPLLARGIDQKHEVEAIGACMGFKRSLWQLLNGFDELLGAGGPLRSAEDTDFTMRALLAGHYVYETPAVAVVHHGFRTWEQGRGLIEGYMYGLGAALVKQIKCGHWAVLGVLGRLAWRWAFGRPVVDLGHRPPRLRRLLAFLGGVAAGVVTPVDRGSGHYVHREK